MPPQPLMRRLGRNWSDPEFTQTVLQSLERETQKGTSMKKPLSRSHLSRLMKVYVASPAKTRPRRAEAGTGYHHREWNSDVGSSLLRFFGNS